MIKFKVLLHKRAIAYYKKCPEKIKKSLAKDFEQLEENPFYFPGKIKQLQGHHGLYRIENSNLRTVYWIDPKKKEVHVILILPRGDVYKKL
jgi:mRNA-degrading endonuclease RelE of RelBE toxin-antitoxin system